MNAAAAAAVTGVNCHCQTTNDNRQGRRERRTMLRQLHTERLYICNMFCRTIHLELLSV